MWIKAGFSHVLSTGYAPATDPPICRLPCHRHAIVLSLTGPVPCHCHCHVIAMSLPGLIRHAKLLAQGVIPTRVDTFNASSTACAATPGEGPWAMAESFGGLSLKDPPIYASKAAMVGVRGVPERGISSWAR